MANDMFGGLLKGLSSFMPPDDPNTKLFTLGNEISDLQQQETQLYASIGKRVYGSLLENPEYSDIVDEINSVQRKLKMAQSQLKAAQDEKEALEIKSDALRCPDCGTENPEGERNVDVRWGHQPAVNAGLSTLHKQDSAVNAAIN